MRRFLKIMSICFICGILAVPQFDTSAQNRRGNTREHTTRNGNGGQRGTNRRGNPGNNGHRPGNSGNNNNSNSDRRPNNSQRPNNGQRPGNPGYGNNGHRPDNPGNNYRPDNGHRPGYGNNNGHRPDNPGNNYRPGNGHRPDYPGNNFRPDNGHRPSPPGYRPGYGHRPGHGHGPALPPPPPYRPYRYAPRSWSRPVPPPHFRPHYHLSPLQAILGFTFGTGLNVSISMLNSGNYYVDGYGDNRVYLRDVSAMDCYWPDATLYYDNGLLQSSTFSYSTSYFDSGRYNRVYNILVNSYGMPVATRRSGNMMSATWWGYDNQYVTLEFQPLYSPDGSLRFYTTLMMGN